MLKNPKCQSMEEKMDFLFSVFPNVFRGVEHEFRG